MNRTKWLMLVGVAILLAGLPALAQGYSYNNNVYTQTRNIPAGTVNDPGSHLTYILDTGVNARELLGDVSLASATGTPLVDLAQWLDQDGDGQLDPGAIIQNYVSITNTSPTMAVTVHFRYFNDNCEDVLDFLVVLTCNDTLLFDPFNYEIPGSDGENTRDRIFGPQRPGKVLTPIGTASYGSGRFILTAAASGATTDDEDDVAEILFPYELKDEVEGRCENVVTGDSGNVGAQAGLVANNLHVFNAAQISFNYLIGYQTYAVPAGGVFQAGGINAWARPAVEYSDLGTGDGVFAPTGYIVTGGETLRVWGQTNDPSSLPAVESNNYYLRSEIQGGYITYAGGQNAIGGYVREGAIGTPAFYPIAPEDIIQHFFSVADDYNGSSNGGVSTFPDLSANIVPAASTFVLQLIDNDENIFAFEGEEPPINVSPPAPPEARAELKMVCMCLRTFLTATIAAGTNVDDLTVRELADVFGDEVLTGGGATNFSGLLQTLGDDLSGGWIRFVRDSRNTVSLTGDQAQEIGFPFSGSAHGPGSSTFDVPKESDNGLLGPSILTGANIFFKVFGFGALSWDYAVASDPAVSDAGVPCPSVSTPGCEQRN